jgi:hypothetical protein
MFIVILSIPYVYIRIYTFNIDSLTDYKYKHLNFAVIARLAQNNIGGGRNRHNRHASNMSSVNTYTACIIICVLRATILC